MIEIKVESSKGKMEQMEELLVEHWDEVARNKEVMILSPDKAAYDMLETTGQLLNLFAYSDGKLVGYSINIVKQHLHYSTLPVCYNDVLFLHKDYRDTPLGLRLINQTEKEAKRIGCKLILWHAKEDTTLAKILPRKGCSVQEIVFSKQL